MQRKYTQGETHFWLKGGFNISSGVDMKNKNSLFWKECSIQVFVGRLSNGDAAKLDVIWSVRQAALQLLRQGFSLHRSHVIVQRGVLFPSCHNLRWLENLFPSFSEL